MQRIARWLYALSLGVAILLIAFNNWSNAIPVKQQLSPDSDNAWAIESRAADGSVLGDAVDLDGVVFQTWVSEREWVAPPNAPNAYTPIATGIRVTNNTQEPVRVNLPSGIFPNLIGLDDSSHGSGASSLPRLALTEADYPLVPPSASIILSREGKLYWSNNRLVAESGVDDYGNEWFFGDLQVGGEYLLWSSYNGNSQSALLWGEDYQYLHRWLNPPLPPRRVSVATEVYESNDVYSRADPKPNARVVNLEGIIGNSLDILPVQVSIVAR